MQRKITLLYSSNRTVDLNVLEALLGEQLIYALPVTTGLMSARNSSINNTPERGEVLPDAQSGGRPSVREKGKDGETGDGKVAGGAGGGAGGKRGTGAPGSVEGARRQTGNTGTIGML